MTTIAMERANREADQADLLAVIHAAIPAGEPFTVEHPAIRQWLDARQLTSTNQVGAIIAALRSTGHITRSGWAYSRRPAAKNRPIAAWRTTP